ncbi:hypothetical protein [Planobispora siamensis]|nr:hypothetical protein [Planobispora siamensis]
MPVDYPTPPGGIPVITPTATLPAVPPPPGGRLPASLPPTAPDGRPLIPPPAPGGPAPSAGDSAAVERGPFQPISAVTPSAPASTPASPAKGRGKTALLAAGVAIAVVGIGTGAFFAYQSFGSGKTSSAATSVPLPSGPLDEQVEPSAAPSPADTAKLNSELTDPGRMSVGDAFKKKVTIGKTTFTLVETHMTQDCDKAAAGAFATALRAGDCRRVLRATYVDGKKKYAVTTGVAVLPTRESAVKVDQAKNLEDNLWFRGLPGDSGTGAERVHIAGGYAAGLVWGRYIVFSYATFADGHTPTSKEKGLGKVSGAFRDQTAKAVERRVTD